MPEFGSETLIWIGIALCVSQSATFSGMNLALFSLSRLQLDVEVASGNKTAVTVQKMRRDSNFLLTTILWGNVGVNVLLTLLSDSVLTGALAFIFSTFVITLFGEIAPQAYFSRNALKVARLLGPVIRFYQIFLFPIAKPSALILDAWLGREGVEYLRERNLRELIRKHIDSPEAKDIDRVEGLGALNFLSLDDLPVVSEGEEVDPTSVISLPIDENGPIFPEFSESPDDPFLRRIESSGKNWVIVTDLEEEPQLVLDSDGFLRHALFHHAETRPEKFCHRPIIVRSRDTPLGWVMSRFRYALPKSTGQVIDHDVILLWAETRRVITGTDILGRLLAGIADHRPSAGPAMASK